MKKSQLTEMTKIKVLPTEELYSIPLDIYDPPQNIPVCSWNERYLQIKELGSGSFGKVVLAQMVNENNGDCKQSSIPDLKWIERLKHLSQNKSPFVAVKIMNRKLPRIKDYNRVKELQFIFSVPPHPLLVEVYEIFVDTESYHLRVVMEPMQQNLYHLMKSRQEVYFSSTTLRSILSQILAGIRHIHLFSFFHRDIKPENILVTYTSQFYGNKKSIPPERLLDRFVVKLADYGLARHINNTKAVTSYVATRWYRAPEILLQLGFYSMPVDIWAFGAVIYEVVTFEPLFPGNDQFDQILKILEVIGSPEPPQGDELEYSGSSFFNPLGGYWDIALSLFSQLGLHPPRHFSGVKIDDIIADNLDLQDVIQRCLVWDPNKRATVEELCEMKYFQNCISLKNFDQASSKYETAAQSHLLKTSRSNVGNRSCTNLESNLKENLDRGPTYGFTNEQNVLEIDILNQLNLEEPPHECLDGLGKSQYYLSKELFPEENSFIINYMSNPNLKRLGNIRSIPKAEKHGNLDYLSEIKASLSSKKSIENSQMKERSGTPSLGTNEWNSYGIDSNPWKNINQESNPFGSFR